jgi:membrane protein involved in colicin uptake
MIQHTRALLIPLCYRVGGRVRKKGGSSPQMIFNHFSLSWSMRYHSSKGSHGVNGSADGIIDSAAATTQWKRNQYRKIEDKFKNNNESNRLSPTDTQNLEPLNIDNYEDVQPMWKEMESRVTRRRSLTLEQLKQRGGVSGRRNIRKSEEDYWERAGVYDKEETSKDKTGK